MKEWTGPTVCNRRGELEVLCLLYILCMHAALCVDYLYSMYSTGTEVSVGRFGQIMHEQRVYSVGR